MRLIWSTRRSSRLSIISCVGIGFSLSVGASFMTPCLLAFIHDALFARRFVPRASFMTSLRVVILLHLAVARRLRRQCGRNRHHRSQYHTKGPCADCFYNGSCNRGVTNPRSSNHRSSVPVSCLSTTAH